MKFNVHFRIAFLALLFSAAIFNNSASAQTPDVIDPPQVVMVISEQARVMAGDKTAGHVPQGTFLRLTRANASWRYSPDCGGWVHERELIDYDKALPELNRRVARDPSASNHQIRGIYYMANEEWEKGLADFEQAYNLGESSPNLHLNIGFCLERLGRYAEAYGEFSSILDAYPDDVDSRLARGNILLMTENAQAALSDFTQATIDSPTFADAHNLRGLALRVLGRNQEAIDSFNEALRLNPEQADALCNRGFTFKQMGDEGKAMQDYEAALQMAPDSASIQNDLAWSLATSPNQSVRDPKRAVELAESFNEQTSNQVSEYLDTLAAAYASDGRFDAAVEAAKLASSLLTNVELKNEVVARQKLYEQKRPYIEQIATAAGTQGKTGQTAQRAIRAETDKTSVKEVRGDKKSTKADEEKPEEPRRGLLRNLKK